jgi:hypothetical protein
MKESTPSIIFEFCSTRMKGLLLPFLTKIHQSREQAEEGCLQD